MSLDARPNPLRALAERKALWLAVPAIALLAGLAMIGSWSVTPPKRRRAGRAGCRSSPPSAGRGSRDSPCRSSPKRLATFSPEQKQELGKIIKEYLLTNPEIFLEAQSALESKMEKEQAEKLKVAIAENARRNLSRSRRPTSPATRTATSPSSSSSITTAATASAACTT